MTADRTDLLNKVIVNERRGTPLHLQVQRALRNMIDEHFSDGDIFFTESALTDRLKVSRGTVRQALGELSRQGVLVRKVAKGTVVTKSVRTAVGVVGQDYASEPTATMTIGVFIANYDSDILNSLLEAVSNECQNRGFRLLIYHTQRGEKTAEAYRQVVLPPDHERIIFISAIPAMNDVYEALSDRGYRTVSIEAPVVTYSGSYVETDATMAVHIGMDYLFGLGHHQITLLVNERDSAPSVSEKVNAYRLIMESRGLSDNISVVTCGTHVWESSFEKAYGAMDEVWSKRPTAIFTVSDSGGWAALKWFAERGICVPADVSILGFGDARSSRFTHPGLSSIGHSVSEIAHRAVEIVLGDVIKTERIAPTLVVRESTATSSR